MLDTFHSSLQELYKTYNEVIKPLIADYEAREEKFPTPIFNEIRAFNDHIAQCYRSDISDKEIQDEIKLAKRHIYRIVLDCYKYLDVSLYEKIQKFEKQTKHVDLTIIKDGLFYPEYKRLNTFSTKMVREAKSLESKDKDTALELYQNAYNAYCEIENLIDSSLQAVNWARRKFNIGRALKIFGWFIAAILSGLISLSISCNDYSVFFKHLFNY